MRLDELKAQKPELRLLAINGVVYVHYEDYTKLESEVEGLKQDLEITEREWRRYRDDA